MRNLNKPNRYNVASIQAQQTLGGDVMQADENGQYVEWRDYKWLLDEVERLRESSFVTAVPVEQYERLRKAGDDMAFHYQELVRIEWGHMTTHIPPSVVRWNAAKEGKQS